MATLSVCIISKNEEKVIERCLKSVCDISDEIIIIDTGSTDKTIEIASMYTNKIYRYPWCDDFSEVRNFSIDVASGEWILILDCDEELVHESKSNINLLLEDKSMNAYCLDVLLFNKGKVDSDLWICRLFRNNRGYKFKNRIHEQIIHCIPPNTVGYSNLKINHYGYDEDYLIEKDKLNRNLRILQSCSEEEKDCFYYYCLGNLYASKKDYKLAIDTYLKSMSMFYDPYGFGESLIINLCKVYYLDKNYEQVLVMNQSFSEVFKKDQRVLGMIQDSFISSRYL